MCEENVCVREILKESLISIFKGVTSRKMKQREEAYIIDSIVSFFLKSS